MTQIIGLSGKKQSGKNTSANIIAGTLLNSAGFATRVDGQNGQLLIVNDDGEWTTLDLTCRIGPLYDWLESEIHPIVKLYSFADPLKEFCMNMFGLTREQCYGTDEQKNSKTNLRWRNFKQMLPTKMKTELTKKNVWRSYMTAREVLQVFGTDIIREIYEDAWVDGTKHNIRQDKTACAIVTDVRFENEVLGLQDINGKVIRLTRNPCPDDAHVSELSLDNFTGFNAVLDNQSNSIQEQAEKLAIIMSEFQNA